MRLCKLIIGSAKESPTHGFKNLKDITIDFDDEYWVTILIGWNGTGKSNVLEALAIIFRDLVEGNRSPAFAFQLEYQMGTGDDLCHIYIDADPDRSQTHQFCIHIVDDQQLQDKEVSLFDEDQKQPLALQGEQISLSKFLKADDQYLPRHVFSYYSGESPRMFEIFRPYLEKYDKRLRNGEDPGMKRLFYALPAHSQFVLLAFLIQQSEEIRNFLDERLGLDAAEGVESVLFVLRQPSWNSNDGDSRFWNARGIVSDFLSRLQDIALAPIENHRREPVSLWNNKTLGFKYLYVKDMAALQQLVGDQEPAEFFRDLESTYVSELIAEVRIRVKLRKNDGSVTFRELSEGEQQLLTVLGLLRFTAEDESLFLLDEPDTHLNPRWSVDYLSYLKQFIANTEKQRETSHILLSTHNPLAIAELEQEQVQILRFVADEDKRSVVACQPEMSPKGMGYAAIVTSDMFGIASTMDEPTQELLERQRSYAAEEELSEEEQKDLDGINQKLGKLGFRFFHPDDEYSRYLRIRNDYLQEKFETSESGALARGVINMSRDDREQLAEQLIKELVEEEQETNDGARS